MEHPRKYLEGRLKLFWNYFIGSKPDQVLHLCRVPGPDDDIKPGIGFPGNLYDPPSGGRIGNDDHQHSCRLNSQFMEDLGTCAVSIEDRFPLSLHLEDRLVIEFKD